MINGSDWGPRLLLPLRLWSVGASYLLVLVASTALVLSTKKPVAALPGMAMSWKFLTTQRGTTNALEQRLLDHDSYLNQVDDSGAKEVLLLARLVTWATLAAISESATGDAYLRKAEQACRLLEWEDCKHETLLAVGTAQLKEAQQ